MDGAGVGGQVGRAGQEGERLLRRGVLGIDAEGALPRGPGGQGALEPEVVPPFVDAGECFVVRGRGRHGVHLGSGRASSQAVLELNGGSVEPEFRIEGCGLSNPRLS